MFKVKVKDKYKNQWKYQKTSYDVFSVRDDRAGYPQFLINQNGQWIYKSAKYFEPFDYDESWIKEILKENRSYITTDNMKPSSVTPINNNGYNNNGYYIDYNKPFWQWFDNGISYDSNTVITNIDDEKESS